MHMYVGLSTQYYTLVHKEHCLLVEFRRHSLYHQLVHLGDQCLKVTRDEITREIGQVVEQEGEGVAQSAGGVPQFESVSCVSRQPVT